MSKFGKYAIVDTATFHFKLMEKWWWKIKPATAGDELNLRKFFSEGRIVWAPDGSHREYFPNLYEQAMREIALTFAGTNIPVNDEEPVEDGGAPLIKPGSSIEEIESVLRDMPTDLVMEIWDHIGQAVPGWGPLTPSADPNAAGSK